MKICVKCKIFKNLIDFTKNIQSKDGHRARCKECIKIDTKHYNENNRDKARSRSKQWELKNKSRREEISLRNTYGITVDYKNNMLKRQNYRCMICDVKETCNNKLRIDHCHKTGKVRAMLCHNCNTALGFVKEDITTVKNLLWYIESHS